MKFSRSVRRHTLGATQAFHIFLWAHISGDAHAQESDGKRQQTMGSSICPHYPRNSALSPVTPVRQDRLFCSSPLMQTTSNRGGGRPLPHRYSDFFHCFFARSYSLFLLLHARLVIMLSLLDLGQNSFFFTLFLELLESIFERVIFPYPY